ncbi:MAG: transposase [Patescibacteria group bacterium]|nr:transposase [Patescibacteria group bacterium]
MRRDFISSDYPVHIMRRGARGLPFARDKSDKWRSLQGLFFLNDISSKNNWMREIEEERIKQKQDVDTRCQHQKNCGFFGWPSSWPERKPLVSIWAFAFSGNHDHLIVQEEEEGGISKFMHKWNMSTAKHFNEKYQEKGAVFQGPYVCKTIDLDEYLEWVVPYVMIKNTFEVHPRGFDWAVKNFNKAWGWAIEYPFSSIGDYAGKRNSPIVDFSRLKEIIGGPLKFKKLCYDMIIARQEIIGSKTKIKKINYFSHEK